MGHFIHACRRDLDITYIVFNNENYALTTGQSSPTTPIGAVTKTTPEGKYDPHSIQLHWQNTQDARFEEGSIPKNFQELKEIIKEAIQHKWFCTYRCRAGLSEF
jgi:2-oxoglutarate ferredoxin oxidoreductase subunit beta